MKKTIVLFFCALLLAEVKGQNQEHYFPIWTYHQDSITIDGISLGLGTGMNRVRNTNTNGIKVELIGVGILIPLGGGPSKVSSYSSTTVPPTEIISERINGLNLSLSGTACNCVINGLSAGAIAQMVFQVNGVSASVLGNSIEIHNGLQLAFLANETIFGNGVQLAATNYSTRKRGLQIGIYNEARDLRGVQIGLWNKNGQRSLPFINWQFKAA